MSPLVCWYVLSLFSGPSRGSVETTVAGIGHDILDFCVRELVTLSGGGVEKKMAISVLAKRSWNHRKAT